MERERIGEITLPSGTLTILDPGHIGMFEDEELPEVPAISVGDLPRDRPLPVWGVGLVGAGPRWDHVAIVLSDAAVAGTEELGEAVVDFARLLLADETNADKWIHSDSIDGNADFVFWGRDAAALAAAVNAPPLPDGQFGWRDLDLDDAVTRGTAAEELKDERGWKLATDFRPHSHHWQLLEQARAAVTQSATITVDDVRVCLFFTGGDGMFPVFVDVADDGRPVQIRIQLQPADAEADEAGADDDAEASA